MLHSFIISIHLFSHTSKRSGPFSIYFLSFYNSHTSDLIIILLTPFYLLRILIRLPGSRLRFEESFFTISAILFIGTIHLKIVNLVTVALFPVNSYPVLTFYSFSDHNSCITNTLNKFFFLIISWQRISGSSISGSPPGFPPITPAEGSSL